MNQHEELKESVTERDSEITRQPHQSEKPLELKKRNGLDKPLSNLRVKASMARELSAMGLEIEAIGRILRTDTSRVEEWIAQLSLEEENR